MELYFVFCEHAQSLNHVQLFENPCTTACQAPLSLEFPSQECWSCLSFPPSGDLPTQGSNPCLLHWQVDSVLLSHMGSPIYIFSSVQSLNCVRLFCNPMDCSLPGFPVYQQLPEPAQPHIHWVGDAIQPSHPLSSPCPLAFNLSQLQDIFQWVSSSHQGAKLLEFQLQHHSFQWIFWTDFLYGWMVWSPCSPRDCQEFPSIPLFKSINFSVHGFLFFAVQLSHPYMTTGKTIALTRWTFVGKAMSLLFIYCLS